MRFGDKERRKPAPAAPPMPGKEASPPPRGDHSIALTGLLAKTAIEHQAGIAIEAAGLGENVALGYVAFDGFDAIADKLGNLVGDQLLREMARRLRDTVREHDHVGHLDRDAFLVVFRRLTGRLEELAIVSRLRIALAEPIKVGSTSYKPILNCGLAHPPADGATLAELLAVAERAMLTMREQQREVARNEAIKRLAAARDAVTAATAGIAEAERGVRDADAALADAKAILVEAKAAVVAATDNAKSLGIGADALR